MNYRQKELELWHFLAKRLRSGQPVVLLVVVESSGSSPGRPGFKMAVDGEGALCGSIGGGIMEIKLVELAKKRLTRPEPSLKRQIHRKTAPRDQSGMICSGEQTVGFLPLKKGDLRTVRRIILCLKHFRPAVLGIGSGQLELQEDRQNEGAFRFECPDEKNFRFEENLGFKQQLYIVGGGHCALALSELMANLDFFINLFDDRPDLNTLAKNRFAHAIHRLEGYDRIGEQIPAGKNVYVVVMTVGYRSDVLAIRQLLGKQFKYFGVLGSPSKMAAMLEMLRLEGFPAEQLAAIHTPVGLPINSRTPEEIAISIAAEIVAVKNGA